MKITLPWQNQNNSKAAAWELILGACIAINLIHFYAVDIFFVSFALLALVNIKSDGLRTVLDDLSFKRGPLTALAITFFIGCSAGYLWLWPLNEAQVSDITQLRWILGLFLCIYAGSQVGKLQTPFRLQSILPLLVIYYLLYLKSQEPFGLVTMESRMLGLYENPNHFGLTLVLLWGVYMGFIAYETNFRTKTFLIQLGTLAGLSTAIIATYSRSSWMGCVTALLVAIYYCRRKLLAASVAALFTLCGLFYATNTFGIRNRLLTTNFSPTGVESGRIAIWKVSWEIFLDNPIFGVGVDQAKEIYLQYYQRMNIPLEYLVGHAHNQYLQVLSGTGLVGFLSYLGLFGLALFYFHKVLRSKAETNLKQVALGGTLLIVALFASSMTDAPFRLQECRNYVLLYLGFAYGYLKTKQTKVLQ